MMMTRISKTPSWGSLTSDSTSAVAIALTRAGYPPGPVPNSLDW